MGKLNLKPPISQKAPDSELVMKEVQASYAGIQFTSWEASPEGRKVKEAAGKLSA